jgi:hypothetical protein
MYELIILLFHNGIKYDVKVIYTSTSPQINNILIVKAKSWSDISQ